VGNREILAALGVVRGYCMALRGVVERGMVFMCFLGVRLCLAVCIFVVVVHIFLRTEVEA
jgi:hypothetical protein